MRACIYLNNCKPPPLVMAIRLCTPRTGERNSRSFRFCCSARHRGTLLPFVRPNRRTRIRRNPRERKKPRRLFVSLLNNAVRYFKHNEQFPAADRKTFRVNSPEAVFRDNNRSVRTLTIVPDMRMSRYRRVNSMVSPPVFRKRNKRRRPDSCTASRGWIRNPSTTYAYCTRFPKR